MLQALAYPLPATEATGASLIRVFEESPVQKEITVISFCSSIPLPSPPETGEGARDGQGDDGIPADPDRENDRLISHEEEAWKRRSYDLTGWIRPFVVRWDRHGRYWRKAQRKPGGSKTYTSENKLTLGTLNWHFRGGTDGDVVGILLIRRDSFGRCWSRCCVVDIDRHDDSVDPAVTRAYALVLYERAKGLGLGPLLIDSNGDGGYHLWLLFDHDVPTEHVYNLGRWLVRDRESNRLPAVETFPKQREIGPEPSACGNWPLLPGRHHTRDHSSKVWDGPAWLSGDRAIDHVVARTGVSPGLIPSEAATYRPEVPKRPERARKSRARKPEKLNPAAPPAESLLLPPTTATALPVVAPRVQLDSDEMRRLIRDAPIVEVQTRHDLMVPEVASMIRRGDTDEEIEDAWVGWHDHFYEQGKTASAPEAHLDDLRRCIAHTRAQDRFALKTASGPADLAAIYDRCARTVLSPALEEALTVRPKPSTRRRLNSGVRTGGPEAVLQTGSDRPARRRDDQQTGRQYRNIWGIQSSSRLCVGDRSENRLVESENDRFFVEAVVLLAHAHLGSGWPEFLLTDDQIRQVILRRFGVDWDKKQVRRRKDRHVRRIKDGLGYEPAGHVELLQGMERGDRRDGGKGSPTRYAVSPLLTDLIRRGVVAPRHVLTSQSGDAS